MWGDCSRIGRPLRPFSEPSAMLCRLSPQAAQSAILWVATPRLWGDRVGGAVEGCCGSWGGLLRRSASRWLHPLRAALAQAATVGKGYRLATSRLLLLLSTSPRRNLRNAGGPRDSSEPAGVGLAPPHGGPLPEVWGQSSGPLTLRTRLPSTASPASRTSAATAAMLRGPGRCGPPIRRSAMHGLHGRRRAANDARALYLARWDDTLHLSIALPDVVHHNPSFQADMPWVDFSSRGRWGHHP